MAATDRISLRTTPQAKALIEQASQLMGVSVNHFMIDCAYRQALEIMQKSQQIQLNETEWQKMLDLLEQPPQAHSAMQQLFAEGYRNVDNQT